MTIEAQPDIDQLVVWLKILAEPRRLQIMHLLMDGVQCNCELGNQLQMAPNLISHHLSVLRKAGLVDMERDGYDGRWVYYRVNQATLDALNTAWNTFFDLQRIQPRHPACGPRAE
ncbi:MAG: ArsR/SmtB family transcription factor [Chloroflexaceae bacterium]